MCEQSSENMPFGKKDKAPEKSQSMVALIFDQTYCKIIWILKEHRNFLKFPYWPKYTRSEFLKKIVSYKKKENGIFKEPSFI